MPRPTESFLQAPAKAPVAILVSHGSPSDPEPQEAVMQALARRVAHHLPDWRVDAATLAAPGRFEAALDAAETPVIYPFFMARGWFTETHLVKRIGGRPASVLPPTGTDPALPALFAGLLRAALARQGWQAADTSLLLAAHGSRTRPDSAESARVTAQVLGHVLGFRSAATGFVEQAPFLAAAADDLGQAICLPFFAMKAGHVLTDLPEALEQARFSGPVLPVLAEAPALPALIADSLWRHAIERHAV